MSGSPTTTSLRRSLTAGVAGKTAEAVTLVLLATAVPRVLGPADYGYFSVALTVVAIGSVAMTLGGATLLARYVPAAGPTDRLAVAVALTRRLARNRALLFAGLAVLGVLLATVDPTRFPPLPTVLVLLALGLNVLTTLLLQADLGLGRAGPWCARYPLQNSVLIAAVLVLHPSAGVAGAVLAIVLAAVAGGVLATVAVAPRIRHGVPRTEPPPADALRFGWLQSSAGLLTQLTQRGGVLAVAVLVGSGAQAGFAALAIGIALAATYAVGQLFTVALPALTDRQRTADADPAADLRVDLATDLVADPAADATSPVVAPVGGTAAGRSRSRGGPSEPVLRRLAGLQLAVLAPLMIVSCWWLDDLVPLVFGAGYAAAAAAFGPALATVLLAPVNALAVQAAALRLRPDATRRAALVGAVAFLLVAAVAVPGGGALGATTAALVGAAASAAASIRLLPGAVGPALATATFGGVAAVLLAGVWG